MFDLTNKNVVYVGGFGDVGFEACHILMQKKIKTLIICSRVENNEMLRKLQAECPTVKVMFVHINLVDSDNINNAVKQIVSVVKHIDVLINGAGVLADKNVETTMNVNLIGLINTTLACLPYMDKTQMGHGGIVLNVSSVFGLEPAPAFASYAAAKHGVIGFTRSLGDDFYYSKTGVCFMCVCPGLTTNEMMMKMRDNTTDVHHSRAYSDIVASGKQQTPKECAINMVKAMERMKNGAIYICDLGQLKEVIPTVHWQMS